MLSLKLFGLHSVPGPVAVIEETIMLVIIIRMIEQFKYEKK